MAAVVQAINLVFTILTWTIIISILMTWIIPNPMHPVRSFLDSIVEPMLAPIRRFMPRTGMIDFSPMVLLIALQIVQRLLVGLLLTLV